MSALQKLIRDEDLTVCLTLGKELYAWLAYVEVAVVSLLPTIEALWYLCTVCLYAHTLTGDFLPTVCLSER